MGRSGDDMTVIGKQVFLMAMDLMDEESQDGEYSGYPDAYKKKTWNLLNLLQAELTPSSVDTALITDENSVLYLDNRTCLTVLPYGLAAHLLMSEDQEKAAFFNARYDELKKKRPAIVTKIKDVYFGGESTEPVPTSNNDNLDGTWG